MPEADRQECAGGASLTTPDGVPNLPVGALTIDDLESKTQDMSTGAMKSRAVERIPGVFGGSTGGSPGSDFTPFGILTQIFAGVNSLIANADPADVQGPEDLPALVLNFIEGLPLVGQLVGLMEAILGQYHGDDPILLQVQQWFTILLPEQIMGPIRNLVNILVDVLDMIPIIGPPAGDALHYFAQILGVFRDNTAGAQGSADTANTGVAILNARVNEIVTGGVSLYDTFSRDVPDMATDADYDVAYSGGSGNMALTNASTGVARWNAVGYSDTRFVARHKTPMGTVRQRASTVIGAFTYGFAGNQAHVELMGRMDAARDNYVRAYLGADSAEIGYVVSGVYTRIGAAETVSVSSGDLWDFEVGVPGDDWRFRLLQNNSLRVDRTDLGHSSMKDTTPGTAYKYVAFGGDCAIGAGAFGSTYQIGMPDFQVFAAADF